MNPLKVRAVARKEFYHLIRDFRSLYLAFIIPIALILLFGYALSLDVEDIKTVVVDYDRSDLSRDFVSRLNASSYFNVLGYLPETGLATRYLDNARATIALIIPPDWTRRLMEDREAPLQVLIDASDPNYAGLSRSYVMAFVEEYNRDRLLEFLNRQGLDEIREPVEGRFRVWFNEDLESRNFIVPGIIAVIIVIVGALLTSLVIAREYENGTMETIRSLPLGGGEFLVGKAVPYFLIGLTDVLIAVLMGQVLYGVVIKSSFWLMVLASSLYLAVALGLGLLISVRTKSQLIANQMAILVTYMPSFLLSDFVFPVENMPRVLQGVSRIVPATYFIDILNGLYLRKLGFTHLWHDYLVLLLMCVGLMAVTYRLLRREGM